VVALLLLLLLLLLVVLPLGGMWFGSLLVSSCWLPSAGGSKQQVHDPKPFPDCQTSSELAPCRMVMSALSMSASADASWALTALMPSAVELHLSSFS
jgi:hypothetical protein